MNKTDLTKVVAETTGLAKKDVEASVNAVFEAITQELANGGEVNIAGFAKFGVKPTAERKGRNPQSGEEIVIPASKKPTFKALKGLKDAIK
ncbi:HU family DNA-binding protein [Paenibacillus tianjinensis]|uniref:HU family DNA-binding protein n=1 Tax=Paenibacillus tianjinensis TaxID=2810347 RepID=A0ABX7L6G0_9BACL|nr:HU family DNA-binding protein [Paenibacillus tianjinensis]QSF43522.1 HU family DNA-binding protein [Paenibacillus tianjinensis]